MDSTHEIRTKVTDDFTILVPTSLAPIAETLCEQFRAQLPAASSEKQSVRKQAVALLQFVSDQVQQHHAPMVGTPATPLTTPQIAAPTSARTSLLKIVWLHVYKEVLQGNSVHVAAAELDDPELVSVYLHVHAKLTRAGFVLPPIVVQKGSALLNAVENGEAAIAVLFGGQGVDDTLEELVQLYETYPSSHHFVNTVGTALLEQVSSPEAKALGFHGDGFNIIQWIKLPDSRPSKQYLTAAPVSFALIGLTQLVQYWVTLDSLGLEPGEFLSTQAGACGHSQGIVSCVAVASSQTKAELLANSVTATTLLFWMGTRLQQCFPVTTLNPAMQQDSIRHGEGLPTPMLSVRNLPLDVLQKHLHATNSYLPPNRQLELALFNGPKAVVVAGHPEGLHGLNAALRTLKAAAGQSQARVPYAERKRDFTTKYLAVSAPFHCSYMKLAPELINEDISRLQLAFVGTPVIPVLSTFNGQDISRSKTLLADIVQLTSVAPVHWVETTALDVTHLIDFGPGRTGGVGALTQMNKEGTGVQVIVAGTVGKTVARGLLGASALFDHDAKSVVYALNYENFAPKLINVDGKVVVSTKLSQLLGKPPLMVAGMTPSTVSAEMVSACIQAGYHVELAGGGHFTEAMLRSKIDTILQSVRDGEGITLNILFLNARQWGFQYALVKTMRAEGIPIDGVCVAAGVPSRENAREIVQSLRDAGVRYLAFKPGSVESIHDVIRIAADAPDFPIILQWTGGRAGGHHSFEDFHQPLLETYGAIRRQSTIVLVGGSGFGDAAASFPYLQGDWSKKFGYPAMPLDGILLGSRMCVALECQTSRAVKERIAYGTPGIADADQHKWENSYNGEIGGVVTVVSELGEPIHKVATRGVLLWKELDKTIFSLTGDKLRAALQEKKAWIIAKLNADFQKVYFGKKLDGQVCDLDEMTYKEVCYRMVELMFVSDQSRWINRSYLTCVADFMHRVQERFASALHGTEQALPKLRLADDPYACLDEFFAFYAQASSQLISKEDSFFFLTLCKRPGQKPVPFIPCIDEDFKTYFKKDSLWQAEDIDAVVGRDVERVCILQGPVAVAYSKIPDEPVKDILDSIYNEYIQLLSSKSAGQELLRVEYLGDKLSLSPQSTPVPTGVHMMLSSSIQVEFLLSESLHKLPDPQQYLEWLAGSKSWFRALLTSPTIVRGKRMVPNPVPRIFRPRPGQNVRLSLTSDPEHRHHVPHAVAIYDNSVHADHPVLEVKFADGQISLHLFEQVGKAFIPLTTRYQYRPDQGYALIHEVMDGRNEAIKSFYSQLWALPPIASGQQEFSCVFEITRESISKFVQATGNKSELYIDSIINSKQRLLTAPLDFAIVAGWKAVIQGLFPDHIDGDLLRLVHLSNSFEVLNESDPLQEGDVVTTTAKIVGVELLGTSGKVVEVEGRLSRCGIDCIQVSSRFLYRGNYAQDPVFKTVELPPTVVKLADQVALEVLKTKAWLTWLPSAAPFLKPGSELVFRCSAFTKDATIQVKGYVTAKRDTKETVEIGTIAYNCSDNIVNPVAEYLKRNGRAVEQAVYFENGGYSVLPPATSGNSTSVAYAPIRNHTYAQASGDLNPIHVNHYFADSAGLSDTITHGMWTSASTLRFVEIFAADNDPLQIHNFSANFVGMTFPGDCLTTALSHVGMRNGRKIIKILTTNQKSERVLEGLAEVDQLPTCYVFTGQGSQIVGMGMDLYQSSAVARAIWDRADLHFRNNYGFSVLNIVRHNPKELTVHFGGVKGKKIRENFMAMTYEIPGPNGTQTLPLFPSITATTTRFTFRHPEGLLASTQFTQPALVLFEKAAFEDMRSQGLVQENCMFAGHSLGEYAALACIAEVLPIEDLVDVCFYRGMTMQCAVPRNAKGISNYGMVAVNPSRVGGGFNQDAMKYVVDSIARQCCGLLEIVNLNVENWQYVVAGELLCLEVLCQVLNKIKAENVNLGALVRAHSLEHALAILDETVGQIVVVAKTKNLSSNASLERGTATIPLPGIDVPFHSRFLLSGVGPFRSYLIQHLDAANIDVAKLCDKYIPNLTAKPFSLSRSYAAEIYALTHSEQLGKVLQSWPVDGPSPFASVSEQQQLGFILVVELLVYQFASPVRWIESQDHLLSAAVRLVEIGPAPTLSQMALRTLTIKYHAQDRATSKAREILCSSKDRQQIFYEIATDTGGSDDSMVAIAAAAAAGAAPASIAAPVSAPAPAPAVPTTAVSMISAPPAMVSASQIVGVAGVSTAEVVQTIVARKLGKGVAAVSMDSCLKDLVGGKSTLQNEIFGDLQAEFGDMSIERPEERPLKELAASFKSQGKLGKCTSQLVNRLIGSKMPAGFSQTKVREHLKSAYGFTEGSVDGATLHAVTMEPADRLASETAAHAYWQAVAQAYSSLRGVPLQSSGSAQTAAAAAPAAAQTTASAAPVAIADKPVTPLEFIRALIAVKLAKPLSDVPATATIKALSAGKSTLQNELIGDIMTEFGDAASGDGGAASEMTLSALAESAGTRYQSLGAISTKMLARLVSAKLPGGYGLSTVRDTLARHGFGSGRQNGVLLMALAMEPPARLVSPGDADVWLGRVESSYLSANGLAAVSPGSSGAGGAGGAGQSVADAGPAFNRFRGEYERLLRLQIAAAHSFLGDDPRDGLRLAAATALEVQALQKENDFWLREHGNEYCDGIRPMFDVRKSRHYDSSWNWVRQDVVRLYQDVIQTRLTAVDRNIIESCALVANRASEDLATMISYRVDQARKIVASVADQTQIPAGVKALVTLGDVLLELVREGANRAPVFRDYSTPMAPTAVGPEKPRGSQRNITHYVNDIARGATINGQQAPLLSIKQHDQSHGWIVSVPLTDVYMNCLQTMARDGVSFSGQTVLLTGAGKGSIGAQVIKALLAGGARVIVTTSTFNAASTQHYRKMFEEKGARNAALTVLPCNMASQQDVQNLVAHIYNAPSAGGLGLDLDFVIPFAAISETGIEITDISSRSELAHRLMLTNLIRLLGNIVKQKREKCYDTRPALALLPLSPNHGLFGNDGLYAESKIGLETLFHKWHSESWAQYLSLAGAVIGWTRGTNLMGGNDNVSYGVEQLGVRTFSPTEMAFNLCGLLHPSMVDLSQQEPIWADFGGGFQLLPEFNKAVTRLRTEQRLSSDIQKAIASEQKLELAAQSGKSGGGSGGGAGAGATAVTPIKPRANTFAQVFPHLKSAAELQPLSYMQNMVDLERVIVVTGMGEVGPCGSARTRWELEASGEFSLEGCIEMAWLMGLIRFSRTDGYSGWVDAKSGQPVLDMSVKTTYEAEILQHSGIRLIEPALFDGYDPNKKQFLHQVAITEDLPPMELSEEEAQAFKREHSDNVDIWTADGVWYAALKKGASLYVPKALRFDRLVAGQIPTGWSAARYGVPEDIIKQVDPVTLYNLVSTAEALVSSGITDPFEFYEYVHVSEVGNCSGGGVGGMKASAQMYRGRYLDEPVQGDILQESFINTMPAWVNLLLLSSSGPIKSPVGACATAVESVELGVDTLLSGKAKVVIVGGYDDFQEEGSFEFASMKATSNTVDEFARGREPANMSRPTTSTRSGFMESHGAGNQILMSAALAVRMGLPIYGIIALTNTATDKEGRSIPAPGQGILTTARERPIAAGSSSVRLLDMAYRRRQLDRARDQINQRLKEETAFVQEEVNAMLTEAQGEPAKIAAASHILACRLAELQHECSQELKSALYHWGNDFYKQHPAIAPIRGALAVWGLGIDDIGVASCHGTSTVANDINESDVLHKQLEHLGRSPGHPVPAIFQKYLTGHPKGAAAAWMLNGMLQCLNSGNIPGNRAADNIDSELARFSNVLYLSQTLNSHDRINSGLLKSFGFGQVGGEVLVIHPDFVLAALSEEQYVDYGVRRAKRERAVYSHWNSTLTGSQPFMKIKTTPPYTAADESTVYLDPTSRARYDQKAGTWLHTASASASAAAGTGVLENLQSSAARICDGPGVGVDIEAVLKFPHENLEFLQRNFTAKELDYCRSQPDPRASLTGRWSAKEAVYKSVASLAPSLKAAQLGGSAPLIDIEILPAANGAPVVHMHAAFAKLAEQACVKEVRVSISHTDEYAMAVAHSL